MLQTPLAARPPDKLLYTDWTEAPGRVLYQGASGEQTLLQAAAGRLYYVAVGPDGVTYLSDANTNDLLRWNGGELTLVYHHGTYLRDIAFDPQGRLYFSESSGARSDGRIFRLEDGSPSLFRTIPLASTGGFWAGNFAFAPDGTLYVSTGNRVGASIYREGTGTPPALTAFYTDPAGSIAGFDFDPAGNLYYADWFHRIYQVTPAAVRTVALDVAGRRFSDVHVLTRSIALGPEAGRVNNVGVHPLNPRILYAATAGGGVFRSFDGGQNWYLRSHGISDPQTDGILVDPESADTVIVNTASGIFRSTDQGHHWTRVVSIGLPLPPEDIPRLIRELHKSPIRHNPLDSSIYAAPYCGGLYRSTNHGRDWTPIYANGLTTPAAQRCITSIDVSPAAGGTVYITAPDGIHQRVGSGAWTRIGTEITGADPIVLRVAPSNPARLYVAVMDLHSALGNTNVWVRATAGGLFVRTTTGPVPWMTLYRPMSLTVDPADPGHVFFGADGLFELLGGSAWSSPSLTTCTSYPICGADFRGVTFDPSGGRLFGPHDQGIFLLDYATRRFTAIEAGLVNTQFYDIDVGAGGEVYGGTQDRGAFSRLGSAPWASMSVGQDVLDILAHPTDPMRLFVRNNESEVLRSMDGGGSFHHGAAQAAGFWNHQLAYDAATGTLYAGTAYRGVYKSADDGITFVAANTNIPTLPIRCLAVQPGSSNTVYAGTLNDRVYKTTDGGTWTPLAGFPAVDALVITFNAAGTRMYAGTSSGIYTAATGGPWSPANTGLPPRPVVSELLIDPVCPCLMYAGLGFYSGDAQYGGGVYESTDGGMNWRALTTTDEAGMSIPAIRIDRTDRSRLYFATFGSGVRTLFRHLTPSGGCSC